MNNRLLASMGLLKADGTVVSSVTQDKLTPGDTPTATVTKPTVTVTTQPATVTSTHCPTCGRRMPSGDATYNARKRELMRKRRAASRSRSG